MLLASLPRLFARHFAVLVTALTATAAAVFAQSPSAADGFAPDVDGNVYTLATQADGRILIGGLFTTVNGTPRNNLARLNADGSLDTAFNPNPNGAVRALAIQGDGQILAGGDFTLIRPNAVGAEIARGLVARFAANGTVDAAFNPNLNGQFQPQVHALLIQANGQIVIGGSFTTTQPTGSAVTTRNYLARFNANGALDTAFNPNPNSIVLALAMHVDNKIVVGGGFTTMQPAGDASASTRNRIARLNANGSLDTEFNPNANNGVTSIVVQRDGKIVLGGFFTTMQPPGEEAASSRTHLARLNLNGSLDSEFYPRAEGNVSAIALQSDGALLVGGTFSAAWGRGSASASRNFVARFNGDGSLDAGFAPTLNAEVHAFAFQPDGKVVVGGYFTRAQPAGATALVRNHIARFGVDGSLDTNFELDAGGRPLVSITQSDGRVVIGGTFTSVGGETHNYVARLNADGSVDSTYKPDLNGRVYAMAYEAASNKVIIGGEFTKIGGEDRNHIARLNSSGTIDSEFNPNIDGQVGVILIQADNRILVGGSFNSAQPNGATEVVRRSNLLRLNNNGTLDTAFDPSPNSLVSAMAVQGDGKILIGGLFNVLTPGSASNTSATPVSRQFIARLAADGTLDTTFVPNINAQVSAIVVQSDNKIVLGGAFTGVAELNATAITNRNFLLRFNTDGALDASYDPNPNGNVISLALQPDGKLLVGGSFTTFQPNGAADWTLRKYAARLNADGTVDSAFNLDIGEQPGNRVDSIRIQPDGRVLLGGNFLSLQPINTPARLARRNLVRLLANGTVDPAFDVTAAGSTGAVVNGLAIQPDGKVIAVGSFGDLGGAKSTNIARFLPEGSPDPAFSNSLTTDGAVNAVVIRPNGAAVPSQVSGFAWLNANGTLRSAFAAGGTRLSGEVNAIAVQANGALLLGGAFANLTNTTGGNLVRFSSAGVIDPSFNPNPNGAVTGIAIQPDGRIVIVGSFSLVGGVVRNRIARLDANGSVDVTYDPNANGRINAVVMEADGRVIIGGGFTSFTPNLATAAITRNYIARINADGGVDATYDPAANFTVNALTLQSDGKVIAGGGFTSVQPNSRSDAIVRNGVARFNADGTVDQNFDPSANAAVNAVAALPNGQIILGGSFTTLQPNQGATTITRNNLARVNSDGAVDQGFNPNANGAVTTLAVQTDGSVLVGGSFTTLQPAGTNAAVARNHLARLLNDGSLDLNFNPDVNGTVSTVAARPDGTVLVGGNFADLQLNGLIYVGGSFANIGGVPARNLASLNENGSVNATFQPRPDGTVNAIVVLADGRAYVGGAFANIAGAARTNMARFAADGTLDASFNPSLAGAVTSLAVQPDGKLLVGHSGGSGAPPRLVVRLNADGTVDSAFAGPESAAGAAENVTGLAVEPDGRVLVLTRMQIPGNAFYRLSRRTVSGSADTSFTDVVLNGVSATASFTLQADGRILLSGQFSAIGTLPIANLARLNVDGSIDATFNPAPNGAVTAVALQSDGRVVIGGGFTHVAGQSRVGIARLAATGPAVQVLGVAANRTSVMWNRDGTVGEVNAVIFELSLDRVAWTRLGQGTRSGGTWQLSGLDLPATGVFYIRARGIAPTSAGKSSGMYESVREFTYVNPIPAAAPPIAVTPQVGAAPAFDVNTGIAARSTVSVVAGEGSVEIFVTRQQQAVVNPRPAQLANLSTRGRVSADSPLILGFAIAGTEARSVLVRAVGPGLVAFGVTDALAATRLEIRNAAGVLVASNEAWAGATELVRAAAATGAFPLAPGSADSAALLNLEPGNYTAQVVDPRGNGGVALTEIYDAGTGYGSRLVNVSSRATAGSGSAALISGFVIAGDATQRVLLRAVGPGLAQFGASGVVADPAIALFDAQGLELGGNDNWVSSTVTVASASAGSGAFALQPGSKDAAVLATVPAGAYTIQVSAPATGAALLEIYEVR